MHAPTQELRELKESFALPNLDSCTGFIEKLESMKGFDWLVGFNCSGEKYRQRMQRIYEIIFLNYLYNNLGDDHEYSELKRRHILLQNNFAYDNDKKKKKLR